MGKVANRQGTRKTFAQPEAMQLHSTHIIVKGNMCEWLSPSASTHSEKNANATQHQQMHTLIAATACCFHVWLTPQPELRAA